MSDFDRDKCVKVMKKLSNKIKDRVADTIFHYTKAEGFKGIIKSKEIWMTNASFVNDKTELRASFEGSDISHDFKFKNPEFNVFKNVQQSPDSEDIEDYYLASFSKNDNSLDQFRAYGDYCIGFEAKKLKKNRCNLYTCVYEKKDIKKWLINKDKLAEWQNECFDNDRGQLYKEAVFSVIEFARRAKLKNKHYKTEEEIRLLVVSNSSWDFPNSQEMYCDQPAIYFRDHDLFNVPVPYVKFLIPKKPRSMEELEKMVKGKSRIETKQIIRNMETKQEKELLPINKVIIGPMQNQEEVVFATKIFLLENGYDKVEVILSDIPFRGK